jgi:hypothetical protein
MRPHLVGQVTAALLTACALSGCASPARPSHLSVHSIKQQEIRQAAADCFARNEGWRHIHGDPAIWVACRNWAAKRAP